MTWRRIAGGKAAVRSDGALVVKEVFAYRTHWVGYSPNGDPVGRKPDGSTSPVRELMKRIDDGWPLPEAAAGAG